MRRVAVDVMDGAGLNSGIYLLILNIPLFFLAFFLLGKRGAIMSTL